MSISSLLKCLIVAPIITILSFYIIPIFYNYPIIIPINIPPSVLPINNGSNSANTNETIKDIMKTNRYNKCEETIHLSNRTKKLEMNFNITGLESSALVFTALIFDEKSDTIEKQSHLCSTFPCHIKRTSSKDGHDIFVSVLSWKTISCEWTLKEIQDDKRNIILSAISSEHKIDDKVQNLHKQ